MVSESTSAVTSSAISSTYAVTSGTVHRIGYNGEFCYSGQTIIVNKNFFLWYNERKNKDNNMKTKYFSNSTTETLDELKANVDRWIISHKILNIVERITSGPSNRVPSEFFIKLSYDKPPKV